MKICSNCKQERPATKDYFYFQNERPHGQCKECQALPEQRARRSNWHRNVRREVLEHYGGETPTCACCGEQEYNFLGIDHISGGGGKHRQDLTKSGTTTYIWLKKFDYPEHFQVLCHNCNLAKGFYGICPHKLSLIKT